MGLGLQGVHAEGGKVPREWSASASVANLSTAAQRRLDGMLFDLLGREKVRVVACRCVWVRELSAHAVGKGASCLFCRLPNVENQIQKFG